VFGADAQDLALAVVMGFRAVFKQQLGHAFVSAIGNVAAEERQGNRPFSP
jgi:hypothetical protein